MDLNIILTTYNRKGLALKTLSSTFKNLSGFNNAHVLICDDGSDDHDQYVNDLIQVIPDEFTSSVINGKRQGVGWMMNTALYEAHEKAPFTLMLEDDWELVKPLDLSKDLRTLENDPLSGMIRYGYMSAGLRGEVVSKSNKLYFKLNRDKVPAKSFQYNYTGHPALRHRRFYAMYGMYKQGVNAGKVELAMCAAVNGTPNGPDILIPVDNGSWGYYHHIGTYSLNGVDPE